MALILMAIYSNHLEDNTSALDPEYIELIAVKV
jgi:hypothetical protein